MEQQRTIWLAYVSDTTEPGARFYGQLQKILRKAGFDAFIESLHAPTSTCNVSPESTPAWRCFRMLLIGYFDDIDLKHRIFS
ncbi:MAG: hypothetical protein GX087_10710 [Desulfobulbaceae bacterium]|nr:hypothetical protein [Desulfobulbaceae bacterium]